uniref:Uncharacterized protein n=1 Tax=Thermogemmatispora argillosa TaxID=2045280 RepID=A0A455SZ28_9CHLR|nr:hypothetical protein KTA_09970 [Thermogemmatispora argillosa]
MSRDNDVRSQLAEAPLQAFEHQWTEKLLHFLDAPGMVGKMKDKPVQSRGVAAGRAIQPGKLAQGKGAALFKGFHDFEAESGISLASVRSSAGRGSVARIWLLVCWSPRRFF